MNINRPPNSQKSSHAGLCVTLGGSWILQSDSGSCMDHRKSLFSRSEEGTRHTFGRDPIRNPEMICVRIRAHACRPTLSEATSLGLRRPLCDEFGARRQDGRNFFLPDAIVIQKHCNTYLAHAGCCCCCCWRYLDGPRKLPSASCLHGLIRRNLSRAQIRHKTEYEIGWHGWIRFRTQQTAVAWGRAGRRFVSRWDHIIDRLPFPVRVRRCWYPISD